MDAQNSELGSLIPTLCKRVAIESNAEFVKLDPSTETIEKNAYLR